MAYTSMYSVGFSRVKIWLITSMHSVQFSRVNMAYYQYVQCSALQGEYGLLPVCSVFSSPGQIWLITGCTVFSSQGYSLPV